jgi:hypothetical protein
MRETNIIPRGNSYSTVCHRELCRNTEGRWLDQRILSMNCHHTDDNTEGPAVALHGRPHSKHALCHYMDDVTYH